MPQLIAFNLAKAYAEENDIEVSGEEIDAEVEQTKEQVAQQAEAAGQDLDPDEAFQEALGQFGYTEEDFREEVRTGLLLEKVGRMPWAARGRPTRRSSGSTRRTRRPDLRSPSGAV